MDKAIRTGDLDRARELQDISQRFVELLLQTGVLPGMKAAFRVIGLDIGPTRAPMGQGAAEGGENLLRPFLDSAEVRPWLA
jgi:N-acetylneuraminate lyase